MLSILSRVLSHVTEQIFKVLILCFSGFPFLECVCKVTKTKVCSKGSPDLSQNTLFLQSLGDRKASTSPIAVYRAHQPTGLAQIGTTEVMQLLPLLQQLLEHIRKPMDALSG